MIDVPFPAGTRDFSHVQNVHTGAGPIQWVPAAVPWKQSGRGVKLTLRLFRCQYIPYFRAAQKWLYCTFVCVNVRNMAGHFRLFSFVLGLIPGVAAVHCPSRVTLLHLPLLAISNLN